MARPGSFSQIYLQFVFAVRYREALINPKWEDTLYKYITGIVNNKGQKMVAINGHWDHIHALIRFEPVCAISDLVRELKKSSTNFVNDQNLARSKFTWQDGNGVFSYSRWDVQMLINYIKNQKQHHKKQSFQSEYIELLKQFEVEYDPRFLFNPIDISSAIEVV